MRRGEILLVEDSEDDADLTTLAFKRANILNKIVVADDGAKAVEHLFGAESRVTPLPVLVILDLNLPKISGLDVLRRIRAEPRTRLLPAVVLTTSGQDEDIIESYALGANAYVRKPVALEDFLGAAARLGMFWLLTNEAPSGWHRDPSGA